MKTTLYVFITIAGLSAVIIGLGKMLGSRNNIHERADWGAIYKKAGIDSAAFEVYEQAKERAFLYNKPMGNKRLIPASTFKIFLCLVALETSVAPSEEMQIIYDGKPSGKPEWDQTLNMVQALEVSSEPYFRTLAQRIGKTELQHWLDSVQYGNKKIGALPEDCWHDSSLLITPDEQVGFMKRLYFDQLPFSKRAQRIVRTMMLRETVAKKYKWYHKTGTYQKPDRLCSWVVGFIEDSTNHPYFYSNYYETKDTSITNLRKQRLQLTRDIFNTMGLLYK
jgi:beta-lactamase class D